MQGGKKTTHKHTHTEEDLIYFENNQYSICPGQMRICAKQFHSLIMPSTLMTVW